MHKANKSKSNFKTLSDIQSLKVECYLRIKTVNIRSLYQEGL